MHLPRAMDEPPVPNTADISLNTPLKVRNPSEVMQKERAAAIRRNAPRPRSTSNGDRKSRPNVLKWLP